MISATVILILTILISYLGLKSDLVKYSLSLWPYKLLHIWRPFTYSFVHNSLSHLINNLIMYSIGFFGFFGKFSSTDFLVFYFSSGFISICHFFYLILIKKLLYPEILASLFQYFMLLLHLIQNIYFLVFLDTIFQFILLA